MPQKGVAHLILLPILAIILIAIVIFLPKLSKESLDSQQTNRKYPVSYDPDTGLNYAKTTDDWIGLKDTKEIVKVNIKLPEGWKYGVLDLSEGITIRQNKIIDEEGNRIAEFKTLVLKPGQKCFDNLDEDNFQTPVKIYSNQRINISGLEGRKMVIENPGDAVPGVFYMVNYCLQEDDKAFLITFYETGMMRETNRIVFEELLSSLEFVD